MGKAALHKLSAPHCEGLHELKVLSRIRFAQIKEVKEVVPNLSAAHGGIEEMAARDFVVHRFADFDMSGIQ